MRSYTVKTGDTLSIIARDELGDLSLWQQIAALNKIVNPNLIYPGQVLTLPDVQAKPSTSTPATTNKNTDGDSSINWWLIFGLLGAGGGGYYLYWKNQQKKKRNDTGTKK